MIAQQPAVRCRVGGGWVEIGLGLTTIVLNAKRIIASLGTHSLAALQLVDASLSCANAICAYNIFFLFS
jgi:hypothetical protein